MKIDGNGDAMAQVYAVRMEKMSQDAAKVQGQGQVQLIEGATPKEAPPVGPNGEGSRINTYA